MDRGERVIDVCNSKSSIRPGLFQFLAIFVFVSFAISLWLRFGYFFFPVLSGLSCLAGCFSYYIRISCLVYSQSCPGLLVCSALFGFIWIFGFFVPRFQFPRWQIRLSIHFLLCSLRTNPISPFLPNSATSAFLFSRILEFFSCVDGVGGGFLFFSERKKIWWLLSFFPFALLNTISNF